MRSLLRIVAVSALITLAGWCMAPSPAGATPRFVPETIREQPPSDFVDIGDCALGVSGLKVADLVSTSAKVRQAEEIINAGRSAYGIAQGVGQIYGDGGEFTADDQADLVILLLGMDSCSRISPVLGEAQRGIVQLAFFQQATYQPDPRGRLCVTDPFMGNRAKTLPELLPDFFPCPSVQPPTYYSPDDVPWVGGSAGR